VDLAVAGVAGEAVDEEAVAAVNKIL
jgi:hypothetical protein